MKDNDNDKKAKKPFIDKDRAKKAFIETLKPTAVPKIRVHPNPLVNAGANATLQYAANYIIDDKVEKKVNKVLNDKKDKCTIF